MNTGKIIFILYGIVIFVGFINIKIKYHKTVLYVKNKYQQRWEDEIKYSEMYMYGKSIFDYFKDTDDPVLIDYKKKYYSAISRLLLSVLIIFIVFFGYILLTMKK